jgi:hypothetical protein
VRCGAERCGAVRCGAVRAGGAVRCGCGGLVSGGVELAALVHHQPLPPLPLRHPPAPAPAHTPHVARTSILTGPARPRPARAVRPGPHESS